MQIYNFSLNKKLIRVQINVQLDFGFAWDLFFCGCEILEMMFNPGWYETEVFPPYTGTVVQF